MLLQNKDEGFWEPSADLCVALMAHKVRPEHIITTKGLFGKKPTMWKETTVPEEFAYFDDDAKVRDFGLWRYRRGLAV